jgi:hypothetical protein
MEDGTLATLASSITNVSAVFALKGLEPAFVLIPAAILPNYRFVCPAAPPMSPFRPSFSIVFKFSING